MLIDLLSCYQTNTCWRCHRLEIHIPTLFSCLSSSRSAICPSESSSFFCCFRLGIYRRDYRNISHLFLSDFRFRTGFSLGLWFSTPFLLFFRIVSCRPRSAHWKHSEISTSLIGFQVQRILRSWRWEGSFWRARYWVNQYLWRNCWQD